MKEAEMTRMHLLELQLLTLRTAGTTTQWHKKAYVAKVNILKADRGPWIGQIWASATTGGIGPEYGKMTDLMTMALAKVKKDATENHPKKSSSVIFDLAEKGKTIKK